MEDLTDRIKPNDYGISVYIENLKDRKYQIPTFQRKLVWSSDNIKKLWDSIYKFYPIGSILIWLTDIELKQHRTIGGEFDIGQDDPNLNEYKYILDGQQRTSALLTSLEGEKHADNVAFQPLYFDLTVGEDQSIDDSNYNSRFLFWDEINYQEGDSKKKEGRWNKYSEGLIVKLSDIKNNAFTLHNKLIDKDYDNYEGETEEYASRLERMKNTLDNYRVPIISLKDIEVPQVCQVFERVNQEGVSLDIFDIVVARTFRPASSSKHEFYLRDIIEDFKNEISDSEYSSIDNETLLKMMAINLYWKHPDRGIKNVTEIYLNRLKTEDIEKVWPGTKKAAKKTFDFFDNHLNLHGPKLIPSNYFYITLSAYFYDNDDPDYEFLNNYFWYYGFHVENLLRNTTHIRDHVDSMIEYRNGGAYDFEPLLIDKQRIREASYSRLKGRLAKAILALFANQKPKDFKLKDRDVLSNVYYKGLTTKPNLHHIFPIKFLEDFDADTDIDENSLMNIAYLPQDRNLEIGSQNPLKYFKNYDSSDLREALESHLIPSDIQEWARNEKFPDSPLKTFVDKRVDLVINEIRKKLSMVDVNVVDTREREIDIEELI